MQVFIHKPKLKLQMNFLLDYCTIVFFTVRHCLGNGNWCCGYDMLLWYELNPEKQISREITFQPSRWLVVAVKVSITDTSGFDSITSIGKSCNRLWLPNRKCMKKILISCNYCAGYLNKKHLEIFLWVKKYCKLNKFQDCVLIFAKKEGSSELIKLVRMATL